MNEGIVICWVILLTKFQANWISFGCATAKSYLAVMHSHPMLHQCFACISFKNRSINFIFWNYVLVDFRQIIIKLKKLKSCRKLSKLWLHFGCNISKWVTVFSFMKLLSNHSFIYLPFFWLFLAGVLDMTFKGMSDRKSLLREQEKIS